MKREPITKQQAAALLRGQLLPYYGYGVKLADGRVVGHGPNRGEYCLNTPESNPNANVVQVSPGGRW